MTNETDKIGFHGHAGAHSDIAVTKFMQATQQPSTPQHPLFPRTGGRPYEVVPVKDQTSAELFQRLCTGVLSYAFIPIENTNSGTFTQNYDLLLQFQSRVFIVGEFTSHDENSLLVSDSGISSLADIESLYSHAHVFDQCAGIIEEIREARLSAKKGPLSLHALDDTAAAASLIGSQKVPGAAVLAHPKTAKMYNLRSLRENVEDDKRSATRYLILAGQPLSNEQLSFTAQMGANKTSMAVILKNAPGMLFKTIGCFALRDLNIAKMESRPSHRAYASLTFSHSPWEYINFIDVECGTNDEKLRNALKNAEEFATELKVFGSYPRFSGASNEAGASSIGGAYGM